MKRKRLRDRFDVEIHHRAARGRRKRPILAQPVDERASAPDDSKLMAELSWIASLKDGHIPAARRRPNPPPAD